MQLQDLDELVSCKKAYSNFKLNIYYKVSRRFGASIVKIKNLFCNVSLKDLLKNSFLILVVILDVINFGSYDIDEEKVSLGTLAGSNNPISEVSYSKKCKSDEIESIKSDCVEISDEV